MITIHELLQDKLYKEFFLTNPIVPAYWPTILDRMPWRVYVQRRVDGPWAKKDFHTYKQAFKFLRPWLPKAHDATIQSRGMAYDPPFKVVRITRGGKPVLDERGKQKLRRVIWAPTLPLGEEIHVWCTYCRRPTVFRWFSYHHAFPKGYKISTPYQRCVICGTSERVVKNLA